MAGTENNEDEVVVKVKGSDGLVWPGGEIVAKGLGSATLGEPDPVIASCPSRTMRQGQPPQACELNVLSTAFDRRVSMRGKAHIASSRYLTYVKTLLVAETFQYTSFVLLEKGPS